MQHVYKLKLLTEFASTKDLDIIMQLLDQIMDRVNNSTYEPSYHEMETIEAMRDIARSYVDGE